MKVIFTGVVRKTDLLHGLKVHGSLDELVVVRELLGGDRMTERPGLCVGGKRRRWSMLYRSIGCAYHGLTSGTTVMALTTLPRINEKAT